MTLPESSFRLDVPPGPTARMRRASEPWSRALDEPIGVDGVESSLRGSRSAIIAVSDGSRSTGVHVLLPDLLERVRAAGIRRVTFAVGSGLHRRPDPVEVRRILGDDVAASHDVVLHDPDDPALVHVGRTRAGTDVAVHPALVDHDAVLLTGAVGFHYYAGFSGGRKAVVPGLAARGTIVSNHLRAIRRDGSRHPRATAGRLDGNPVHLDMVQSAALVRPTFLVNTVMGEDGGVEQVFAGHWRRAHEAACRYVRRTRTVRLAPRSLVVVSAGGAPYDIDLVQSHKAFEAAFGALRSGGTLVLVARCPDGLGPDDFDRGLRFADEREHVRSLLRDYRVYVQTALAWRKKAGACRLILVSGLADDIVRRTGAEPARDLDEALRLASAELPAGTAGWVLPHGVRWRLVPHERGSSRSS